MATYVKIIYTHIPFIKYIIIRFNKHFPRYPFSVGNHTGLFILFLISGNEGQVGPPGMNINGDSPIISFITASMGELNQNIGNYRRTLADLNNLIHSLHDSVQNATTYVGT